MSVTVPYPDDIRLLRWHIEDSGLGESPVLDLIRGFWRFLEQWCADNLTPGYQLGGSSIEVMTDADAILFKMRWSA